MTSHPDPDPGSSSANYDLLDRLADEFAERFRRGERPSLKEYTDRYPHLADDILALFPALVDLEQADEVRQEEVEDPDPSGAEAPPQAPALAQVGDYRVLREIGHGGMGVVYEAEQVSLGRRVALKILPQHVARDPKMLERFRREARAAARLHHTNIVPVFEVGREGDLCYYAMQFIQGQGLDLVYDELRRLRGRAKEKSETGARPIAEGTTTHADRAAVGQVVQSLLTGRFGDDPLPAQAGGAGMFPATFAGAPVPVAATGMFAPVTDPEPALARTEADSAAGDREKVPAPTPPGLGHPSLPTSAAGSAVLPGGSQISTIESGCRDYFRCVARIGLQAAQGLAYAHARGVIHRDIKPSNLLLDTAGVVWITDFGLAKADGDGLTQTGDVLGTLRYMAPERFSGGGDARADVYGLGLTLYELLTLEPAFEATDRLRLIEQIKSVDPVRPRLVDRRLPRDLETIILKAIDKDARRRYQTADELAEDLRRFRDDEPILARRATAVECYARWARRNPGVAVLGGVLTAVLVLATVASLVVAGRMTTLAEQQRQTADSERVARLAETDARQHEAGLRKQAEQARRDAEGALAETQKARRDAEAALAETQVERNRAEENFQRARAVVDQYFTQVSESQLLSVPGLQTLRRDLLRSALSFYADYLTRRGQDPGLRAALAAVHLKAAKIHLELGDRASAEKDYRGALPLYEALSQAEPADTEARNGLAECHYGLGESGPAGKPRQDALLRSANIRQELVAARPTDTRLREDLARSYQALGESQRSDKQVKEALDSFLKARTIAASLVGDHPDDPAYRHDFARNLAEIAECLCTLGRHKDETIVRPMAIDHARAAYEQAPQVVAYGRLYGHLLMREGDNLRYQKRYEECTRSLRQALKVEEKLIRENPAVPDLARELASTYIEIVGKLPSEQRPSDSVLLLRQACELIEALPLRGPDQLYALAQLLALRASKPDPARPRDEDEARQQRDSDLAVDALGRAIAGGFREVEELKTRARSYFPSLLARPDVKTMLTELEARVKAEALARETSPAPGETPKSTAAAARDVQKTQGAAATESAHQRLQADLAASERAIALIHLEMGKTLEGKGDFDGGLAEIREAVRLRPDDPAFRGQVDATLRAKVERDGALAALRREAARLTPGDFAGHLGLARRLAEKKDLDGAIAEFRAASRIEPDNPDPHKDLAALLRDRGDSDGALAERRDVVRITPGDAQAHVSLGIALYTKRDLDGALTAFRDAVRLTPGDANSRDWLGFLLNDKGDHDEALVELREAIRINPNFVSAHKNLGGVLFAKGDKAGAIAEFRAIVRLTPSDASNRDRLVDLLKTSGDTAGAEAVLREAKTRDDNFARELELGRKLWDKKDLPGAVRAFRMAAGIKPDNVDAQRMLAETLRQNGDGDAAISAYRVAIRLTPDYGSTHNNFGLALEKAGDLDGAIAQFRAALRIDGRTSTPHTNLSRALLARNDLDGALGEAREAVRIKPDDLLAQRQLGFALVKRGNLDEARAALGAAWPEPGLALAEYAHALRRAGMIDKALAAATESVRLAPSSARAHENLGWALLGKRDWSCSAAAYRESIRLHPDNYSTHHQLGVALRGMKDWGGAIPAFRESLRLNPDYATSLDSLIAALTARRKQDAALAAAASPTPRLGPDLTEALDPLMAPLLAKVHPDEGIAVLDDLIQSQPGSTRYRTERARALVELGRREEAAAEFSEALSLLTGPRSLWGTTSPLGVYPAAVADPEVFQSLTRLRPDDRHLLVARLNHLGRQRQWREAAAVAPQLSALDSPDDLAWHFEAGLLSWIGDREGYHRVCRGMLERYGTSSDPTMVRRTVLSCLLEPDAVADLGALGPLVERTASTSPPIYKAWAIVAAGLYEYRMGRYREAIDRLHSLPEALTANASDQCTRALACVLRAMSHLRLDRGDESRRQLSLAEALARQVNFDPERAGPLPVQWNDWLRYYLLRREAEGLIRDAASQGAPRVQ